MLILGSCFCLQSTLAHAAGITRQQILTAADQMADAQLHALGNKVATDWTWGVMEAGLSVYSHVSPNGHSYQQALEHLADQTKWTLMRHPKFLFDPDDYCLAQTFVDLYADHPAPDHLAPWKNRVDALADHLHNSTSDMSADKAKLTFAWCDTLFMAPPLLSRMSAVTGDPKYLDAMDGEYWRAVNQQYDPAAHLFFRDTRYIHATDANGKKIYWSRGNGWVLAGLARVLQFMPADYPRRKKYETLFKDLSTAVAARQGTDGLWRASLADPDLFPGPETSGSALFTYALAWGVNHRLLDDQTYRPVVTRAWEGLLAARRPDNLPGFTQPEGNRPGWARKDSTRVYCTGAYLLAASELQTLAPFSSAHTVVLRDPGPPPTTAPIGPAGQKPSSTAPSP